MAAAERPAERAGVERAGSGETLRRKNNAQAVDNFKAAAPLLKPDANSYARNQYRLGFALLNLKKGTGREGGVDRRGVCE